MPAITPHGQAKLAALAEIQRVAAAIYALTERFASAKLHQDQIAHQIKRRYSKFKITLVGAGFDHLSELAGGMEIAAGRSGSQRTKARILREGLASIRFQLDMEEKAIRREETVEKRKKEKEQKEKDQETE